MACDARIAPRKTCLVYDWEVMVEQYLSVREVRSRLGIAESTLYRLIARNEFPRPVKLGRRRVAWPESEVEQWCQERRATRDASSPSKLNPGGSGA